jgi:hypothetical protein
VGHLQKGHGVAFADLNNDGTQDMVVEMGGAYPGDAYHNAFFFNPGQGNNNWIGLKLEGVRSNKPGIGAKITAIISEDGKERMVYRELNSGGSFGCSPLRQHIGIGNATVIRELKIVWPASGTVQVFKNVIPNRVFKIREDKNDFELVPLKSFQYKKATEAGQDHHH